MASSSDATPAVSVELLQSLLCIARYGSYTKAAEKLRLTQPAISAQMKRLQSIVGGELFSKVGHGVELNERGKLVAKLGARMLDVNEQLVLLGGTGSQAKAIRIGLPPVWAEFHLLKILRALKEEGAPESVQFFVDTSDELSRNLAAGVIDVAMLYQISDSALNSHCEWTEELRWLGAPNLVVRPGRPIPLVSAPARLADRIMFDALDAAHQTYVIAVVVQDNIARYAAARAGLGYIVVPGYRTVEGLNEAHAYYLPKLSPVHGGLYVRDGLRSEISGPILRALQSVAGY